MKRLCLVLLVFVIYLSPTAAQTPEEKKATIAYVQKLQTNTGGFLSMPPAPNIRIAPTLRATSAAVRALHYLGGDVPNKEAAKKFVESCYHADSGGFSDFPRGKPEVVPTAVGLMAMKELRMPTDEKLEKIIAFLTEQSKTFEEVRMAAAGLELVDKQIPEKGILLRRFMPLADEESKSSKSKTRSRAARVVTWLRLGGKPGTPEKVVGYLQAGQAKDGGFGKGAFDEPSDLETTYRVMRAFVMLKGRPGDVNALRGFISRCRNADRGYGVMPGESSTVSASYFAAIIYYWLAKTGPGDSDT
jgi:hypothetical protein